jgi:hypothetical protein
MVPLPKGPTEICARLAMVVVRSRARANESFAVQGGIFMRVPDASTRPAP